MIRKVAVIEGLGYTWFDRGAMVNLIARLKSVGFDTGPSPFHYQDSQGVFDFLKDADWRGFFGDSFGACFAPDYARELSPRPVDYIGAFQPSDHSTNIRVDAQGVKYLPVPTNVAFAHCIRDPVWMDTLGLGYATYRADDPKKTRLVVTEHRGAHPDDAGYTQDLLFQEVKHLIGA